MRAKILLLIPLLPLLAHSATLHVSPEGSGTDGLTWETAYPTISEAVTASTAGDSLWVKAGVYEEAVESFICSGRFIRTSPCLNPELRHGGFVQEIPE